jgi:hypothetical protein
MSEPKKEADKPILEIVNGYLQGTVNGRQWRGPVPKGSRSRSIYRAVQAGAAASGFYRALATNAERFDSLIVWLASDDAWTLAMETLQGWTITDDGTAWTVTADAFDELFAGGRVTEVTAVASTAWEVLGYLTPPGVLRAPQPGEPTPSSSESVPS